MGWPQITQDRIGVSPQNWKLELWKRDVLRRADAGIREPLTILMAGDFETYESCEGGPGHAYPEPTIRFHGGPSEGFAAFAWLRANGVTPTNLRRIWTIEDGEPHGPTWEMTFHIGKPEGSGQ